MNTFSFFVASTVALVSTAVHAGNGSVTIGVARFQDANGLTNLYAGGSVAANHPAGTTFTNASATPWQSTVTQPNGLVNSIMSFGGPAETYSESYVDSWIGGYGNGTWSANLGNGTFQFNTTPYHKTAAQRNYLTLTSSSFALWNNIVATNATGSFTFELTQSLSSLGFSTGHAFTNLGGSTLLDVNSTSFTVNVTQTNNPSIPSFLSLVGAEPSLLVYSANGDNVGYLTTSSTVIGGAVPAPGAIALLGLAGLAGRRRR
jgi:MYXO-CTERM domain-containing protein